MRATCRACAWACGGSRFEDSVDEVGDERAGRLTQQDGFRDENVTSDLQANDVGIDGAGAVAEEPAVHVIDDDQPPQ